MAGEKTASFSVKLEADVKDVQSAFDSVRSELNRLKGDFDAWSKSAVGSIEQVTQAMRGLGAAAGGVGAPGMGGGGGGGGGAGWFGPSMGYGGLGPGTTTLRSGGVGGVMSAAGRGGGGGGGILGRLGGFLFGMVMESLGQGLGLLSQYERGQLYAAGMPAGSIWGFHPPGFPGVQALAPREPGQRRGGRNYLAQFGLRYGMNVAEVLPFVHSLRQPLAAGIDPMTARLAGMSGLRAEELASVYGFGTGVAPQVMAMMLAQSDIGGIPARQKFRPASGLGYSPGVHVAALAGYLTTAQAENGISKFGFTIQETIPLMQSLNQLLSEHMAVAVHYPERMMEWMTAGIGFLGQRGINPQVAQNIVGSLFQGMRAPGGGEIGRALMYQAVGYVPGMDPFEARLRLESGDPRYLGQIFGRLQSQYGGMGQHRVMAAISSLFNMSATQAQEAYYLMQRMQVAGPDEMEGLREQFEALRRGEAPLQITNTEAFARGSLAYMAKVAELNNEQLELAQQFFEPVLKPLMDTQIWVLEKIAENLPKIIDAVKVVGEGVEEVVEVVEDMWGWMRELWGGSPRGGGQSSQGGRPPAMQVLFPSMPWPFQSVGPRIPGPQQSTVTDSSRLAAYRSVLGILEPYVEAGQAGSPVMALQALPSLRALQNRYSTGSFLEHLQTATPAELRAAFEEMESAFGEEHRRSRRRQERSSRSSSPFRAPWAEDEDSAGRVVEAIDNQTENLSNRLDNVYGSVEQLREEGSGNPASPEQRD